MALSFIIQFLIVFPKENEKFPTFRYDKKKGNNIPEGG